MNLRTTHGTRVARATLLATLLLALCLVLTAPAAAAPAEPNGSAHVRITDRSSPAPVPALPNVPMGKSTIGNYVWHDFNANGDHSADLAETEFTAGIDGVVLNLYMWDTGTSSWVYQATTTTGDDPNTAGTQTGWYQFPATSDLAPGIQYEVRVDPVNFGPGKPLEGMVLTSAGVYFEPITLVGAVVDYKDADFGYAKTSLTVTKSPPTQTLLPGSTATFTVNVKNTGEVALENIVLTENLAGATCTPNPIPGPVAPGATVSATCTYIMGNVAVVNTVSATGTPVDGNGDPLPGATPSGTSNPVDVLPANPAIQVVKEVSVDGGATWQDANSAPGPALATGTNPQFKFTITNTGNVTLTGITLTDSVYTVTPECVPPASLAPSATYSCTITRPWALGPHTNTATTTGSYTDDSGVKVTPSDTDDANYFGANPAIQVVKEVSVDGGLTWLDANSTPGPSLTNVINPQFRFTITNIGNVTLTNITLSDSVYTVTPECVPPASLAPAATYQCVITRPWAVGQHTNTATTTGTYTDDGGHPSTPRDTDDANYFGANPAIQVVKEVSLDGGFTWQDANTPTGPVGVSNPQFRFTITNIGNVTLTNITLSDSVYTVTPECAPPASLAPTATYQCVITRPWAIGQHTNTATTTGTYTDDGGHPSTPTDTDNANYFGADPKIQVVKEVSVDGGGTWQDANTVTGPYAGSGVNPQFRFTVTNIGNVTLTNITLTDNLYGPLPCTPPASLAPAATYQCVISRPWAVGQHTNTATTTGDFSDPVGPLQVSDTDDANYFGADPKIQVVKTAGNAPDGSPLIVTPPLPVNVTYTYVVTNPGNVPLFVDKTGVDPTYKLTDDKCSPVTYVSGDANNNNLLETNESWTFTCTTSISETTTNTATVTGRPDDPTNPGNPPPGTTPPTDTDTAVVEVQTGAIGDLVWWDVNGNGVQDAGEPGIPGVTVILAGFPNDTTDPNGIYGFSNVPPGPHTVTIPPSMFGPGAPLEGFTTSPTGQGTPTTDSNGVVTANGVEATVNLPQNTNDLSIDFGFVKPTSYRVEKTLLTASPTTPSSEVHFQIKVTNTGQTYITTLPLVDTYDVVYLTYGYGVNYASPASNDNLDDGTINWTNVAPAGGLAPLGVVTVDVWFTAKADTLGIVPDKVTINTATVPQQGTKVDPDGPNGAIPPADSPVADQQATAPVQIINPTGVVLARAGVTVTDGSVVVSWETADERTLLGFNVLRGASASDLKVVTSELLLAQTPGLSAGATYRYADTVAAGSYYYALELVGLDGTTRRIELGAVMVGR